MSIRPWRSCFAHFFVGALLHTGLVGGPTLPAQAQDTALSGLVFGDYYWVATHHDEDLEGRHGLWLRRIYLTLDREIDESWAVRVRGEMNQPGDFTTSAAMTPRVKDAYLRWTNGEHTVYLGLASTPTWGLAEEVWGYRSVEKTALDLYKFGSSRDLGVAVAGRLGSETPIRYHAMIGNGSGTGAETNTGKKAMLSLAVSPLASVTVEAYGDVEKTNNGGYYTLQGALYYQRSSGRLGIQYAHQTQYQDAVPDAGFDFFSIFGRVRLSDAVRAFARFDRQFQPNPAGDEISYIPMATTASANFVVGGLEVALNDQVRIMPNVEAVFYDGADGPTPGAGVLPRFTFYYWF